MTRSLTLALVLAASPMPASSQQPESPVACDETLDPAALAYGDHTTGCQVDPAVDADVFAFAGIAGDLIRINLRGLAASLDPRLELLDPVGSPVVDTSCTGSGSGCSVSEDVALAQSGVFEILVSDLGADGTGAYALQLELLSPVIAGPIFLPLDSLTFDTVSPATDVDRLFFHGDPATSIRLEVDGGTDLTPRLEVRDPAGATVADEACSAAGCAVSVELTPTLGFHTIFVSDGGVDGTGSYFLDSDCLAGPCDGAGDGLLDPLDPCRSFLNPAPISDASGDGIPDECQCGDCNGDGFVTTVDAFTIVSCLVNPACAPTLVGSTKCDGSNDGFTTTIDAFLAVSHATATRTASSSCSPARAGPRGLPRPEPPERAARLGLISVI